MSTQFTNRQWRLPNNENKDKQSNYSMDFDGNGVLQVDNFQLTNNTDTCSYSAWINIDSSATGVRGIFGKGKSGANFEFNVRYYTGGTNLFIIQINGTAVFENSSLSLTTDTWHHIIVVIDRNLSAGNNIKLFVNNAQITNESSVTFAQFTSTGYPLYIGAESDTATSSRFKWVGQIDAVAIYNYALTDGTGGTVNQIAALYGSSSTGIGNPMSLSPKPVAYYPLGDQDAFNGANYLVPNIAAQEDDGDIATSYSPYALDFDAASSDYITLDSLQTFNNEFSVSVWLNPDDNTEVNLLGNSSTITNFLYINSSNQLQINSPNFSPQIFSNTTLSIGSWQHVILTRDSNNIFRAYKNGDLLDTSSAASGAFSFNQIGRYGAVSTYIFNGKLSNISIWDTALTFSQVTEIYSEGIPQNLLNHSAVSSLVSWWQLGSNSSFNSSLNQWTCIDEKGTNTGESSQTFNEDAIVDGVGSYANGLSSGMGGDEVIGSAPFSDANSLSINMDVLDRVEDTPS